MPTVRDPAIQGKKALGFSPNIHEPNYKNKKYKQKNPFLKKSQGHYKLQIKKKGWVLYGTIKPLMNKNLIEQSIVYPKCKDIG